MAKPFQELREKMSDESQVKIAQKVDTLLKEMAGDLEHVENLTGGNVRRTRPEE